MLQRSNLAQLTKMQPKGIYKGYKVAKKSLQAYSIKMQYEIVFKGDGCCSCYTCLPQTVSTTQTAVRMVAALGIGAPPKDQRLLTNTWPKIIHNKNIHANNSIY